MASNDFNKLVEEQKKKRLYTQLFGTPGQINTVPQSGEGEFWDLVDKYRNVSTPTLTQSNYKKTVSTLADDIAPIREREESTSLFSKLERAEYLNKQISSFSNMPTSSARGQDTEGNKKKKESLQKELDTLLKGYGSIGKLRQAAREIKAGEYVQKGYEMGSVGDSASEHYDKKFAALAKENKKETDELYAFINNRDNVQSQAFTAAPFYNNAQPMTAGTPYGAAQQAPTIAKGDDTGLYKSRGYHLLTQAERDTFNYHWANGGKEQAEKYLYTLQETLNERIAEGEAGNLSGNVVGQILYGTRAGLDQFGSGMDGLFRRIKGEDQYVPQTATQIASTIIREDLTGLGRVAYDVTTTSANMMPSVLASTAANFLVPGSGAIVGTGLMGASASGNAYQEMINQGYDVNQARAYGVLVGGSEAALQYVLGGITKLSGGSEGVFGSLAKKGLEQIDKGIARFAIKYGAKMLDEGLEEGIQEVLTPIFQRMVGNEDAKTDWGEVAYSALLGTLSAGIMESGSIPSAVKAIKAGIDPVTGLTKNERQVVEKLVEDRVAEESKNGKVSQKQKDKIFDEIVEQMDKGYISTDTIEEVLGGETYKSYKDTVDSEDSLFREYEELGKKQNATLAEQHRYQELTQQVKDIKSNSQRNQLKSKLGEEVFGLIKGDRLVESYNERSRRGQAFEADLTKYDEKQRAVVQKAIESGILNNTNRTHEFVDLVAKISADKGVLFDFTNNEKLKESGFAVDGKSVNGYVTKDGITVNIQSSKALNSIVGHEITHVLEGTDLYTELQKAVVEFAKAKNDYQGRYDSLTKLYEGIEDADVDAELTADLVGDYLFTDSDFINNLSANHRNVFQKIYDEVKYLLKVATAGSKEARELEKVKRAFEKAYKADSKAQSDTKYSIAEIVDENHRSYGTGVHLDSTLLDNLSPEERVGMVKEYVKELGGETFTAYDPNGNPVGVRIAEAKERFKNKSGKIVPVNKDLTRKHIGNEVKQEAIALIDELIVTSEFDGSKAPNYPHGRLDNNGQNDWEYWKTYIQDKNNTIWEATLNVVNSADGNKILYDISPIRKVGRSIKLDTLPTAENISQNPENVKRQFSLSDSNGRQLSNEQQEYFKDSVVRDESGNLKVMYHGTSKGGFNVFNTYGSNYGLFGVGSYFTDSKTIGESYTKKGKGKNPQVYEAYLNIKNPMDMDAAADPAEWAKAFPDADFPEAGTNEDFYRAVEEFYADQWMSKWEVADEIQGAIESGMGYDGITHIGGGRVNPNGERHRVYIAFQPEQIKSVDNAKPTDNPDIRYSLSDSDGNKLTKEQAEYFKNSKMRDADGNLKVMYHGSKDGGFHVFDPGHSDDGRSLFFVDSNDVASSYSGTSETYSARNFRTAEDFNKFFADISADEYEVREKDGKFHLYEDGDLAAVSDTAEGIYEEFRDWSGLGYGDVNYKVYLNLENPLEVDAKGREWNELRGWSKAAFINAEDVEVKRVGDEFKLFDKNNAEIENAGIVVNQYNENMDTDALRSIMVDKVNSILSIKTENLTTTRDVSKWAKTNGYDGVIFKNILDVGGYGGKYNSHTVAIAFDSNQIKSAANTQPTGDPDIRFSLSEAVEETDDLIAVHNLYASELPKALALGGMPMPSIAVLKAQQSHEAYGDVSLIFPKDTIDPQKDKDNKIYGGDAWTPVYPSIEYKANAKAQRAIESKIDSLVPYEVQRGLGHLSLDYDNLSGDLNRFNGDMYQAYRHNYAMQYAFLVDNGFSDQLPMTEKQLDGSGRFDNAVIVDVVEKLGVSEVERLANESIYNNDALISELRELANENAKARYAGDSKLLEVLRNRPLYTEKNFGFAQADSIIRAAYRYIHSGIEQTVDYKNAKDVIEKAVDKDAYKKWVDNLFAGIVEKEGIRNNADFYTPSGNRRSWEALHWENTLENVLKVMKAQNETGQGFFGGASIFGVANKNYGSIEEVKADSDRLRTMPEEEYDALKSDLSNRLSEIADSIKDPNERNRFIALDHAVEEIVDAVRARKTKSGILQYMQKWNKRVTSQTVDDIVSLINDVANMPTGYFEAKPRRAVSFDEVGVFVIPRNADVKLKQELLNRGYSIAEYDPDVEGDRQKVVNQFEEYKFSLSNVGEPQKQYGNYNVYGKDIALDIAPDPVAEESTVTEVAPEVDISKKETTTDLFPDEVEPAQSELNNLLQGKEALEGRMLKMAEEGDFSYFETVNNRYQFVTNRIAELENEISQSESDRLDSISDEDAPPEMDAPYYGEPAKPEIAPDPFMGRDMDEVAKNRKVKAYQFENPEVKPFFMDAANGMMGDLNDTIPGEKIYNDEVYYQSGGEKGWMGTKRQTTDDIAWLKDTYGYTYDQIRDGVKAIIEDNGKENNAVSKRIEFLLHDRLVNGYTGVWGEQIPPNQEYINFLKEREINEYSSEAFDSFMATADQYAPMDDIGPVAGTPAAQNIAPVKEEYIAATPKRKKEPKMVRVDKPFDQKTASVLAEEPKVEKKKPGLWSMVKENILDNGMVFEDLALKTKNRDLQAKWNFIRYAQSMAQRMVGNGTENVKSLNSIREEVEKSGKTQEFYEYLYHWLNVDRMTLETRYENTPNKAVFGDSVTADMSRATAVQLGKKNPEFRRWAQDVYRYNSYLRTMMVNNGVISQETADLWREMYPHYVPIRRVDDKGLNINVPLDTGRTGVNAPIKKATGGNSDILPLFDTMAQRTMQTYKAIAKNSFGVELKNTLGTTITKEQTDVDGVIEGVDRHEELLQEGKNGKKPTFTVFENGEKVTFEITDEMYNAMKPASDQLSYTNPVLNKVSNFHRGLLTEYNPVFMATNAIKDTQDILINSQHPVKTYANLPRATLEIARNGKWFREYMEHGGEDNTYFDGENNSFDTEEKGVRKLLGIPPLSWISKANNFIERTPRLAEYIASRESGRSIEVSMLDAARVTTNFAAGGKLTKFANRNGATFLNASVQGVVQQARNFREAKMNGFIGAAQLAGKIALAGLPALLFNHLMWDDDEEYEELSDYVKQNYYIFGKYGDGKFVRIPKGRTLAVIQNAFEQVSNAITGNDEVDLKAFAKLLASNLGPNNPVEDHILAPVLQVSANKTWYGGDLVPTRLQDLPAAEQYDESTDAISKWLGEKLNVSPYKINYLLDQYSGGVGDTILPMLTPEAESGDNTILGNILAPLKSKFTTDSVMNNQNVSDFYDLRDELAMNAKASTATDEDKLKAKYINSLNSDLSELYAQKREWQNSDFPANVKYEKVRGIQQQIVDLMKEGMSSYQNVSYEDEYARVGGRLYKLNEEGEWQKLSDDQVTKYEVTKAAGDAPYATDGTNHFRWYVKEGETEGEWRKVTEDQLEKQNKVTSGLGITPEEYWGKKEEYDFAFESPESYAVAKAVGGYDAYKQYSSELNDISADKDEYGKSISGSRKEKVLDYINSLDADYYTKLILYKSEYNSYDDKNYEIIEYLNGRDDISFEEEIAILRKLGFDVTAGGDISW